MVMNQLPLHKRVHILHLLVEGNSLRSTSRIADVSINTVTKLLIDVGKACDAYQDHVLTDLPCKRIQVDEIWSFCYAKQKNISLINKPSDEIGDVWTWTSICAKTKIVPTWFVGDRSPLSACIFMKDLASRMKNRIQLTSDGYLGYQEAIEEAFIGNVDYAKIGRTSKKDRNSFIGKPDPRHISTSFCERNNLTMRMSIRRFTRSTNAFSKKIENHKYALAIHFMYYNFGRIHKTLRCTPAMASGISKHIWNLEEILNLAYKSN